MVQAKDKGKVWKGRQGKDKEERVLQKKRKGQNNVKEEEHEWRISKEICETHAPNQETIQIECCRIFDHLLMLGKVGLKSTKRIAILLRNFLLFRNIYTV